MAATTALINCLDGIEMGNHAVDYLQPFVKDVMDTINKVPHIPAGFEGLSKLRSWCGRSMQLSESFFVAT
jgi:hypothetical protein